MVVSVLIACILAVVFIAARVTIASKNNTYGVVVTMLKTLASLGFIAVAITAIFMNSETVSIKSAIFIVAGLIMGMIGDIVLDLKVVYLRSPEESAYLTSGMASFGIGHIFYFTAMMLYFGKNVLSLSVIGICIAVAAVAAFAMVFGGEKLMKFHFGKFTIHSVLYAFVLLFMGAIGVAVWVKGKAANPHIPLFAMGMIVFLLSDVVLTQMYFGGKAKDKFLCVVNHALYYAAQICIAAFVFYM